MRLKIKRIAVIGNGGGGKTTLSRRLHAVHQLPLTHVDSIQYIEGMKTREIEETRQLLSQIADAGEWIIDGFGPIDVIENRFSAADRIVSVDFPLWRHYWWCTKRQIKSIWLARSELPESCNEAILAHTVKLYRTLWRVHTQIRPQLLEILSRDEIKERVTIIRDLRTWNVIFRDGLEHNNC